MVKDFRAYIRFSLIAFLKALERIRMGWLGGGEVRGGRKGWIGVVGSQFLAQVADMIVGCGADCAP